MEEWMKQAWAKDLWWSGKTTRRRFLGFGAAAAGALGAGMLVPAPWREAFGASAKPYKIGCMQPLTGAAASGGRTALVGSELAVNRINKSGGINGRPIELVIGDYESNPAAGVRKLRKLILEDEVDAHQGGYLSNVCLAMMPLFEEHKVVNMIGVCLDTTITTSKCSRYSFRTFDYAPAQAKAFAPFMVNKIGKRWHILYADYAWGQSTKDSYAQELEKNGGKMVGSTGIPIGTADMTPFLSKITGEFDGLFMIFFGRDGVTVVTQSSDLGFHKRAKFAGDGANMAATLMPAMQGKNEGFYGLDRYIGVQDPPLNTPYNKRFIEEAVQLSKKYDPQGIPPDRFTQSNFEAMNFLKVGIQKSGFQGRKDGAKLIEALEGMEVKEGDDFPQGDKLLRKEDHQAFLREFIYQVRGNKYYIQEVVPKEKTLFPPACTFPSA
jgi:branched-chain amino acid transport system substrate-binding protein